MLRGNRFRLVTLGRLTLLGAAGEEDASLAKRRLKLALLVVLAMARRPLPRDTLLEMFWGEQDEARARHSLSNALSSLRRALGQRAITTRDADVALAPDLPLDVDALELAEAMEGRDYARVVDLYSGSFLDGIHIDESPSFDQWSSREGRRLEGLFLQACAQQCASLARSRRWEECESLAHRWLDAAPLSSDAAIFLLNAIKAPATRSALAHAADEYERLRTRLRREFNLAPEPVVSELAERIRQQLASAPPDPREEGPAASAQFPPSVATEPAAAPSPAPAPDAALVAKATLEESPELPPATPTVASHRALWMVAITATVVSLVTLGMVARGPRRSGEEGGSAATKPVIAVLTMDVRTLDSSLAWLGDGLPQMISGKLAHITAVDVVPQTRVSAVLARSGLESRSALSDARASELAQRIGATLVARGALGRDGANLVLDLSVRDVRSGNLIQSAVLTRGDALSLADEAAARILGAANINAPGPQLAELETSSLEAYQHYMRAIEAGQAGRLSEYEQELDAAIALDSGFISVLRSRISAAVGANDTALVRRLRETLRRHADRATEFDRMDQEAYDAFYSGERERSEALARALVRRYPRDPRAYHTLEMILGGHGEFEENERVAVQGLALDSLAMEAGSGPCTQCIGLSTIVGLRWIHGDMRGAAEWARRWIRAQPDNASAWATLAWNYSYMQRTDSALPLMQRAVSLSGGDVWATGEFARMLLVARRYEAADSAISIMEASASPKRREIAADLRSLLEREHGRFRAANRVLDRMLAEAPGSLGLVEMVRAANLRSLGDYVSAARKYEAPAHSPSEGRLTFPMPSTSARAFCWHHALAADAYAPTGDTATLQAKADTLEAACSRSFYGRDWRLFHHVRGLIAARGGRFAEAEKEFAQAIWTPMEGWSRTTVELAKAQAALNRPADAISTLRTAYATRLDAMARYVPVSELDFQMAQAFAQAGQLDSARTYAAYVRRAWRDADPETRQRLEQLPK